MKNNLLCGIIILTFCISCNNTNSEKAEIKFSRDTFFFYNIRKGDSAVGVFNFTNIGNADLEIIKLGTSCGCTNAYMSNNRIKPNEKGQIFATYHSNEDLGNIVKTIIVESNTKPVLHVLYIKGVVN